MPHYNETTTTTIEWVAAAALQARPFLGGFPSLPVLLLGVGDVRGNTEARAADGDDDDDESRRAGGYLSMTVRTQSISLTPTRKVFVS